MTIRKPFDRQVLKKIKEQVKSFVIPEYKETLFICNNYRFKVKNCLGKESVVHDNTDKNHPAWKKEILFQRAEKKARGRTIEINWKNI